MLVCIKISSKLVQIPRQPPLVYRARWVWCGVSNKLEVVQGKHPTRMALAWPPSRPCESRDFHFWQLSQFADEGRGRVLQDEVRGGGQARSPPPPPPPFALPSPNIPHPTLPPCTHTWSCYGLAGTTNSLHNDLCLTLRSPATLALSVLCTTEPEAPSHTWEIHCDRHSSSTLRGLTGPLRHVSFTIRHDGGRPDSNGQTLSGRIQVSARGQ
jgi:hypothetical protein